MKKNIIILTLALLATSCWPPIENLDTHLVKPTGLDSLAQDSIILKDTLIVADTTVLK
jgi:hypothetical protein